MLELLYTRQTRHTAGSLPIPSRTPAGPSSRQQHSTNTSTDTPAANLVCSRISSPTPHLHVTQKHPSMGPAASGAAGAAGASARPSSSKPAGCWPQQTSSTVGLPLRFVDTIASKLAFFPPQPPCYTVEEHKDGTGELYIRPVDRCAPQTAPTNETMPPCAEQHSWLLACPACTGTTSALRRRACAGCGPPRATPSSLPL